MISYENFFENLSRVEEEIREACEVVKRGRESILLLPVTKTHSSEVVEYVKRAGLRTVGENRVQEAAAKKELIKDGIKWELIGHLQSNKIGLALRTFDRIQSVDSESLLLKLEKILEGGERKMPILLQVNVSEDPAKYGLRCEEVDRLVEISMGLKNVKLEGLMTIPQLNEDRSKGERAFNKLREVRDEVSEKFGIELRELSMGMSGDFVEAIKAGSTIVRIGSRLFGFRE